MAGFLTDLLKLAGEVAKSEVGQEIIGKVAQTGESMIEQQLEAQEVKRKYAEWLIRHPEPTKKYKSGKVPTIFCEYCGSKDIDTNNGVCDNCGADDKSAFQRERNEDEQHEETDEWREWKAEKRKFELSLEKPDGEAQPTKEAPAHEKGVSDAERQIREMSKGTKSSISGSRNDVYGVYDRISSVSGAINTVRAVVLDGGTINVSGNQNDVVIYYPEGCPIPVDNVSGSLNKCTIKRKSWEELLEIIKKWEDGENKEEDKDDERASEEEDERWEKLKKTLRALDIRKKESGGGIKLKGVSVVSDILDAGDSITANVLIAIPEGSEDDEKHLLIDSGDDTIIDTLYALGGDVVIDSGGSIRIKKLVIGMNTRVFLDSQDDIVVEELIKCGESSVLETDAGGEEETPGAKTVKEKDLIAEVEKLIP
ncbi:MAG: hypothetical protein Fur0024_0350 [Patescibacteria group bacterium]